MRGLSFGHPVYTALATADDFRRATCVYIRMAMDRPRLTVRLQRIVGIALPKMLATYLTPDAQAMRWMLQSYPCCFPDAARIVDEVNSQPRVVAARKRAARPTLRMLARSGVFEDACIRSAFVDEGFGPGVADDSAA